jgi:aspartyl-tRNA(Asn)/glutamyl-tRNA(Gln) amidotransferase subunit A
LRRLKLPATARFGVRYGRAPEYTDLRDMYTALGQGFGPKSGAGLTGTTASHGYYDAYYLQAQRIRKLIAQDLPRHLKPAT